MRGAILAIIFITAASSLHGFDVNVHRAALTTMSPPAVFEKCDKIVDTACTVFRDARLTCMCNFRHGRWAPAVSIAAQPHMYTSSPAYVAHELTHILDFNMAMRKHAEDLEDRAFASRAACEAFAGRAEEQFVEVLRDYMRASTWLRDHRTAGR